jgi:hypothetical protein
VAALRALGAVLLLLAVFPACSSAASTEDEVIMSSADAVQFVGSTGETVFWDIPRTVVWDAPRGLFYELPRQGILSLQGREAQAGAWIDLLESEDLRVEEQVAISEELQAVTGLPLHSSESWRRWWESAEELSAKQWLSAFTGDRIDRLASPDYFTRASAIDDLAAIYGTTLGYDPKHPADSIAAGAEVWRSRFEAGTLPEPAPGPF